jgi:Acetoacetate decarboxylase (ADC)
MRPPRRINAETGRYSLVDGIPFQLPVASHHSPALMAAFSIDADRAAELLPGSELHPLRISGNRGVLMVSVIDYLSTNIGRYIEFSIAIAVTHGLRPAPPLLPLIMQRHYDMGQYVFDLPVSTEISVKGGKGIWGMPKHQANLDFRIDDHTVSSQYDLDGHLAMRITIRRPRWTGLPVRMSAINFCEFRGMLFKSSIYFHGHLGGNALRAQAAELLLGDSPRVAPLREIDISRRPIFAIFFPAAAGILDDHYEGWFVSSEEPPTTEPEGLKSVVDLGLSQAWLAPPSCAGRQLHQPQGVADER